MKDIEEGKRKKCSEEEKRRNGVGEGKRKKNLSGSVPKQKKKEQ